MFPDRSISASVTVRPEALGRDVHRVALGDAAEVDAHARLVVLQRPRDRVVVDALRADSGERGADLVVGGHAARAAQESPGADQRLDRDVVGAAALAPQPERRVEDDPDLGVHRRRAEGGLAVEPRDLAGRGPVAHERIHALEDGERARRDWRCGDRVVGGDGDADVGAHRARGPGERVQRDRAGRGAASDPHPGDRERDDQENRERERPTDAPAALDRDPHGSLSVDCGKIVG
jgi:hypothetical protein